MADWLVAIMSWGWRAMGDTGTNDMTSTRPPEWAIKIKSAKMARRPCTN